MSAELERGLLTVELLSRARSGMTFTEIATELDTAKGPTHRLLAELTRLGYVRLDDVGRYHLTLRPVSQALSYLERIPVVELARPLLDRLATASGELARLNLVDGPDLVRVAKAQGRQYGLRYDPEHGGTVPLACAASGYVLLSGLTDEEAITRLEADGFAAPGEYGAGAPRNADEALTLLHTAREQGYLYLPDIYEDRIATLAYPIRSAAAGHIIGVLTISGPSFRFTPDVGTDAVPLMAEVAEELGQIPLTELVGFSGRSTAVATTG